MDNVSENEIVTTGERDALRADDVVVFFMHFAIAGHVMSKGWVETIAKARAWRILWATLREYERFWSFVSPCEFVVSCCRDSHIPSRLGSEFVEYVERLFPGTIASAHDECGRNAIVCTTLREPMKPEEGNDLSKWRWTVVPELVKTLEKYGCQSANKEKNDESQL